jgi:hypothetical protein
VRDIDRRVQAALDLVLEEVCRELPSGGDHESRKFVAEQLIHCVTSGKTSLGELAYAGRRAIGQLKTKHKSA